MELDFALASRRDRIKKRQEEEDAEAAAELQAQEEGQAVEVGSLVE